MDECLPDYWFANPLDIQETEVSAPVSSRRDEALADTLAKGQGASDASGRAKDTHQHIQSYVILQPSAKRPRNLTAKDIDDSMLLKYVQVQEAYWPNVQHFSVSSDGFRVSTKDVVYYLFCGKHEDCFKAAWTLRVT